MPLTRAQFEAIVYVLRTGCQWKALPRERFGSASAVHKKFMQWSQAGFFEALWKLGWCLRRARTRRRSRRRRAAHAAAAELGS
ncbi:MAG: hypothetical protein NVS1B6_08090 [Steroidobacteraceae bacterium]